MERVYVVTHPEASHHVDRLVGGWYESALTPRGLTEARQIACHLRHVIPHGIVPQIVSSDLLRTRQAADAIAEIFETSAVFEAGLREKSYGQAEGRPQRWLDERFIFPPAVGERMDHDEGIIGAETKREWVERVYRTMERVQRDPAPFRILVTHGGSASLVIASWMRIPTEACADATFRVPTGSISVLELDDRFHNRSLVTLGERSFITGSK